MIYTVTLNPAIDKTAVIPGFSAGRVNRIRALRRDAGGKGLNISKCLASLGMKSTACLLAGGSAGGWLLEQAAGLGLELVHVALAGEARTNLKIIDPERGETTDVNEPGPEAEPSALSELRDRIAALLRPGDIVTLSGSLPRNAAPGVYEEWTARFSGLGARVFLDADGEAMRRGVRARPWLVKPNGEELSRILGRELASQEAFLAGGEELLRAGIGQVVISLGAEGALFLSAEGRFRALPPKVRAASTVGAGDAMVAAMAYGLETGLDRREQMRLAVAMGTASVTCDGSQAPGAELIRELAGQVGIQEV